MTGARLKDAPAAIAELYPQVEEWRREFPWTRDSAPDLYRIVFVRGASRLTVKVGARVIEDEAAARWAIDEVLRRAGQSRPTAHPQRRRRTKRS